MYILKLVPSIEIIILKRILSNLRRPVLGETQNLPGIGKLWKFSGKHEVVKLKFREL